MSDSRCTSDLCEEVTPVLDSTERPPAPSGQNVCVCNEAMPALDSSERPAPSGHGVSVSAAVSNSIEPPAALVVPSTSRGLPSATAPADEDEPVPSTSRGLPSATVAPEPADEDENESKRRHLFSEEVLQFYNFERLQGKAYWVKYWLAFYMLSLNFCWQEPNWWL